MVALPHLFRSHNSIFLGSLLWKLDGIPGGKTHWSVKAHLRLRPTRVFHSLDSPHSAISNLSKWPLRWAFQPGMAPVASAPGNHIFAMTLWTCLSLQSSGWQFTLQPQFSNGFKKSHWLSVCSAFSSKNGSDKLLSSLHAGGVSGNSSPGCSLFSILAEMGGLVS